MHLANAEFMLLQLLYQEGDLSGYEINKLVQRYGYREWAAIGSTSIYVSLVKLEKKKLVVSYLDTEKTGKGPLPKKYKLASTGEQELKNQVTSALANRYDMGARFNLGLSALPVADKQEIIQALHKRISGIEQDLNRIKKTRYEPQGGERLPQHVMWLFEHNFLLMQTELQFARSIVSVLLKNKQ